MLKEVNAFQEPIIFFDGICNLCNYAVNLIIKYDKKNIFKFSPLQSEFSKRILKQFEIPNEKFDTIILFSKNKFFRRSDAFLEIAGSLGFPFTVLKIFQFFPLKLRDIIYTCISNNRHRLFGTRAKCMVPNDSIKNRFL